MSDLHTFIRDLDRFAEKVDADLHTFISHISLFIFKGVVMKTPVKTGRARANWNIGVRRADLSTIDEGYSTPTLATKKAMEQTAKLNRVKDGYPVVYITNNLPYIKRLEEGWSVKQAPEGMVRLTLLEAREYIKSL